MNLENFVEQFAELFDEIDPSEITAETKYKELEGWNSLQALSIIAMIDEEYDVAIKGKDIRNTETIQDVFNVVKENM